MWDINVATGKGGTNYNYFIYCCVIRNNMHFT